MQFLKLVGKAREGWQTLAFALREICKADPKTCVVLATLVLVQGILPALSIAISSSVISNFAVGHVTEASALILSLQWAGALALYHLLSPWILFLQSNLADRSVFMVNDAIIKKASAIQELGPFEDPAFHNDLKLIQAQSAHKPLNLVVTLVGLVKDGLVSLSCLALLFSSISWIAVLVIACTYAQCRIFARIHQNSWKESLGRSQESRRMNYLASLSIQKECAKEIRCFNMGPFLQREHQQLFKTVHNRVVPFRLKQVATSYLPLILTILGGFCVFFYVVRSAVHGELSIGAIALLLQSLAQLHLSVGAFSEEYGWMNGHLLFFKKYREFLQSSHGAQPKTPSQPLRTVKLRRGGHPFIQFQDVSFSYPCGKQAISNISLEIHAGQRIALVGPNGSGKSTFIKLLCGFYRAEKGVILIRGKPLDTIPLEKWRAEISPVFQDFFQYALSLRQNIVMGNEVGDQTVDRVLSQVDLSLDSTEGHDQLLEQTFGGTDLSKGQWQKVALARALYKDAPLYLLDEPNSFLDPLSEAEVFKQFAALSAAKTVVFITHRLGSVKLADQVVLLDQGRMTDVGTHQELVTRSKLYNSLYTTQAAQYFSPEQQFAEKVDACTKNTSIKDLVDLQFDPFNQAQGQRAI